MTEAEGLGLLQVLLKAGAMQKRGLQFHDVVLKESKQLRRPVKGASALPTGARAVSSAPVPKPAGKPLDDLSTHTARNAAKAEKQACTPVSRQEVARFGPKGTGKKAKKSYKKAAQLIGPGGDLSKIGTASSVPRDISQVGTDQRPPVVQEKANPVIAAPKQGTSTSKNPMKVVL